MKPLLLLIITIVFSSNIYAEPEELDREKYVYYCHGVDLEVDKHGNTRCKGIRKGDVLYYLDPRSALLYCDNDPEIIMRNSTYFYVTCFYNGKPIKEMKSLK
jgi:hypothetical protein